MRVDKLGDLALQFEKSFDAYGLRKVELQVSENVIVELEVAKGTVDSSVAPPFHDPKDAENGEGPPVHHHGAHVCFIKIRIDPFDWDRMELAQRLSYRVNYIFVPAFLPDHPCQGSNRITCTLGLRFRQRNWTLPIRTLTDIGVIAIISPMNVYSTAEVAKIVGVSESTLERWLAEGSIKPPKLMHLGQRKFRLWTEADIKRTQKYKEKFYWEGRGGNPKAKN